MKKSASGAYLLINKLIGQSPWKNCSFVPESRIITPLSAGRADIIVYSFYNFPH